MERERKRAGWNLHLEPTAGTPPRDSSPSPEVHPEYGVLPSRPPPDPPTSRTPPTQTRDHAPSHPPSYAPPVLPHQQVFNHPGISGCGYDMSGHTHQPPSSHVTASSMDSSVFAYGSSSDASSFPSTNQTTPSSSQTTPSNSETTHPGSTGSEFSGLSLLHFSYRELSEATGGFTEGMVGIGAFGTVFRAKIRGNGPYAVKKLHTVREQLGGLCE